MENLGVGWLQACWNSYRQDSASFSLYLLDLLLALLNGTSFSLGTNPPFSAFSSKLCKSTGIYYHWARYQSLNRLLWEQREEKFDSGQPGLGHVPTPITWAERREGVIPQRNTGVPFPDRGGLEAREAKRTNAHDIGHCICQPITDSMSFAFLPCKLLHIARYLKCAW